MKLIKLILFSLLACALNKGTAQQLLFNEGIRGPVKSITHVEYNLTSQRDGSYKKGSILTSIKISCDKQGCLMEQLCEEDDYRDNFARWAYEYDAQGRMTVRNIYYKDGDLNVRNLFSYDSKGRPWEIRSLDGDDDLALIGVGTITYENDRIIEKQYYSSDADSAKNDPQADPDHVYIYNLYGDMLEESSSSSDIQTYRYLDRDSHQNWTRMVKYDGDWTKDEDATPSSVTIRTISYW